METGFVGGEESNRDHRDGGGRVTMAINRCRKPTIAALNGSAVGVGITMTLPMNIRIAYQDAKIGFVFARRGLVMEAASSFFLPRLIGLVDAVRTNQKSPANCLLYTDIPRHFTYAQPVLPTQQNTTSSTISSLKFSPHPTLYFPVPSSSQTRLSRTAVVSPSTLSRR